MKAASAKGPPVSTLQRETMAQLQTEVTKKRGNRYSAGAAVGGLDKLAPQTIENLTYCYDPSQVADIQGNSGLVLQVTTVATGGDVVGQ